MFLRIVMHASRFGANGRRHSGCSAPSCGRQSSSVRSGPKTFIACLRRRVVCTSSRSRRCEGASLPISSGPSAAAGRAAYHCRCCRGTRRRDPLPGALLLRRARDRADNGVQPHKPLWSDGPLEIADEERATNVVERSHVLVPAGRRELVVRTGPERAQLDRRRLLVPRRGRTMAPEQRARRRRVGLDRARRPASALRGQGSRA